MRGAPPHADDRGEHGDRRENDPAEKHGIRVAEHRAVQRLADAGTIPRAALELREPVIYKVVAHVCTQRRGALTVGLPPGVSARQIGRESRDLRLVAFRTHRDPFDYVTVLIARRERHPRVEPRRILTQLGIELALLLDERAPIHARDRAETSDAVGHHDLRDREPVRRERRRDLPRHSLVGDRPALAGTSPAMTRSCKPNPVSWTSPGFLKVRRYGAASQSPIISQGFTRSAGSCCR